MTRIMAGWIALTPELSAKLLLGRHVWDNAQHTDAWGRRLPELRAHAQESEPPNDAFVGFMDAIEAPEEPERTAERLAGIYRVLKPHLLAVYESTDGTPTRSMSRPRAGFSSAVSKMSVATLPPATPSSGIWPPPPNPSLVSRRGRRGWRVFSQPPTG